jgi:REP element-mobilizing transposase RayT
MLMHFHLIWTTYGTWLPGDDRGWIRKGESAVQPPNPAVYVANRGRMKEDLVLLDAEQREIVAETITVHCRIRKWELLALAVRCNHIHVVVGANCDGEDVRDQLKAWCSRKLSDGAGLGETQTKAGGRKRWFTEGACISIIDSDVYLENAIEYVEAQQEQQ